MKTNWKIVLSLIIIAALVLPMLVIQTSAQTTTAQAKASVGSGVTEKEVCFINLFSLVRIGCSKQKIVTPEKSAEAMTTRAEALNAVADVRKQLLTTTANNVAAKAPEIKESAQKAVTLIEQSKTDITQINVDPAKTAAYAAAMTNAANELNKAVANLEKAVSQADQNIDGANKALAEAKANAKKANTIVTDSKPGVQNWASMGSMGLILGFLFGDIAEVTASQVSSMIITIAVWLLIFVTFGDIIAMFSTFSKWVSWTAAGLMGIIAANLGFATKAIAWITGFFAILGTIAVYVGLVGAFLAFLVVNLGFWRFRVWVIRRKILGAAATSKLKTAAGGTAISGVIRALGNIKWELEKQGEFINNPPHHTAVGGTGP